MDDLVERLRDGDDLHSRIEAADRIEKLEAENVRLRGGLCLNCFSPLDSATLSDNRGVTK